MPPSTESSSAGPRILIVDDQQCNVRLLDQTLRRAGYVEVMSTTEPREVATLHLQHRYDLILLDLQMPEMNGLEVIRELEEIRRTHRVAILVISADPGQATAALLAGANSFLNKPFRLPDVVDRVQLVLKAASEADAEDAGREVPADGSASQSAAEPKTARP